ncbi:MAG: alpha/beta hydrolase [Vulcanimicrobiaceae bacterium]
MESDREPAAPNRNIVKSAAITAAILGATATAVAVSARQTERAHPATGRFLTVDGVTMHYIDAGTGSPIVLIHGNAMSGEDYVASGIVADLARRHRVIVFDRPGFGHTERPRGTDWTPIRQAALIHAALAQLGIADAVVVGHSLGSLVAVALAIAHREDARALVLLSGYYYPTLPFGLSPFALPALPVLSDISRFTVSPVVARMTSSAVAEFMFAPAPVAASFADYPLAMSRRPSQIRATTEDASFMDPAADELQGLYGQLRMPIEILAGDGDKVVNTQAQSERLSRDVANAHFATVPHAGHMIHYIAPDRIVAAIEAAARRSEPVASGQV